MGFWRQAVPPLALGLARLPACTMPLGIWPTGGMCARKVPRAAHPLRMCADLVPALQVAAFSAQKLPSAAPAGQRWPCMALFMPNNSLDNFFTQRAPGDARCIQWRRGVAGGRWSGRGRRGQRWAACPAAASARCLLLAAWRHSKCQPLAAIHFLILPGSSSMAASELACWMHSVRNWHCSSKVMSRCSSSLSSLRCAGPNTP